VANRWKVTRAKSKRIAISIASPPAIRIPVLKVRFPAE